MSDPIRVGGEMVTCPDCGELWHTSEDHDCPKRAARPKPMTDAEKLARYEAALRPFAHFAEMWEQKPLNRASDEHVVYGIHGGTPWEGMLTLGDFRRAREALAAAQEGERT